MSKVSTNINLYSDLKKSAQDHIYDLRLDLTTAVTLFLKQSVREQAIPFEIKREIPKSKTTAAMNEFYEMQIHPEKYKRYPSFKAAMQEVLPNA